MKTYKLRDMRKSCYLKYGLLFSWIFLLNSFLFAQKPAIVDLKGNDLTITISGRQILQGKLTAGPKKYRMISQSQTINGAMYQVVTITGGDFKAFELQGRIMGGNESIACESEPRDAGLKFVRHSVGPSHNLRNQAVYDRQQDWLLSFDLNNTRVNITPVENNAYTFQAKGWEIVIRFRPEYYQKHRGLSYFNPKQYQVWKKPVVGWCSWFAYFDQVKEDDIRQVADVISEKLKPYGLEYLQIDDGYQQLPIGLPQTWLQTNRKFPSGLKSLADYITSKGLTPGIWTNVSFADSATAYQNKSLFVKDQLKNPAQGNWVGYIMDGSNPAAIQQLITPVYQGLKNSGWRYYKLDALRHLKYEGYNAHADYFKGKGINRNEAFRNIASEVRKQIGRENFLLACWGIRPELVGIADGCRIGNDGFSYAGLAQFNSYNNIIWRNDPDHIVLSEKEAYRSCTATSLTGSLFMLTDKPEIYKTSGLIEAAKRSIPVLYTQPGQVYDVDPSASSKIALADIELSGSGPRPFDASTSTTTGLFAMELNMSFEHWMVLGRLDERDKIIPFADLGLDAGKEFLVFEFWSRKFLGSFKQQFLPPSIDTNFNCQVFCLRERQNHPQVLATNRHISCGGLELSDVKWENQSLTGTSELIKSEEYMLYIYEPEGVTCKDVQVKNGIVTGNTKDGAIRMISITTKGKEKAEWSINY